jgi:hypothetical protein
MVVRLSATNLSLASAGIMLASGDGGGLMLLGIDERLSAINPSLDSAGIMLVVGDGGGLMMLGVDGELSEINPSIATPIPTPSPKVDVASTNVAGLMVVRLSATNPSIASV